MRGAPPRPRPGRRDLPPRTTPDEARGRRAARGAAGWRRAARERRRSRGPASCATTPLGPHRRARGAPAGRPCPGRSRRAAPRRSGRGTARAHALAPGGARSPSSTGWRRPGTRVPSPRPPRGRRRREAGDAPPRGIHEARRRDRSPRDGGPRPRAGGESRPAPATAERPTTRETSWPPRPDDRATSRRSGASRARPGGRTSRGAR